MNYMTMWGLSIYTDQVLGGPEKEKQNFWVRGMGYKDQEYGYDKK